MAFTNHVSTTLTTVGNRPPKPHLMANGDLVIVYPSSTNTVIAFAYSTDDGANWTQCATTLTTGSFAWDSGSCSDGTGFIYVNYIDPGGSSNYRLQAFEFTGTDVVARGSSYDAGHSVNQPNTSKYSGGMLAILNPDVANSSEVLWHGQYAGTMRVWTNTFNRSAYTWGTKTEIYNGAAAGYGVEFLLRNTSEDFYTARTPDDPEAYFVFRDSDTVMRILLLTWDGTTNYRWNSSPSTTTSSITGSTVNTQTNTACYDPVLDEIAIANGYNTVSYMFAYRRYFCSIDAWQNTPTYSNESLPSTWDGQAQSVAQFSTDGLGHRRVWSSEYLNQTSTTGGYDEWDGENWLSPSGAVEGLVDMGSNTEVGAFSVWNSVARYNGFIWVTNSGGPYISMVLDPQVNATPWQLKGMRQVGGTSASQTINMPYPCVAQPGDVVVISMWSYHASSVEIFDPTATGFTQAVVFDGAQSFKPASAILYKIVETEEPIQTVVVAMNTAANYTYCAGQIDVWSPTTEGAVAVYDTSGGLNGGTSPFESPALTLSDDGGLVVRLWGTGSNPPNWGTTVTGHRLYPGFSNSGGGMFVITASADNVSAGSTGTPTITGNGTAYCNVAAAFLSVVTASGGIGWGIAL